MSPRTAATRLVAVLLAVGAALLLGAGPALAHTRLQSTDPADGSSIDAAPGQITLTFNERMETEFATITVIGPDGSDHRTGEITADGGALVAPVELGAAGRYEIGYRVVSDDGHPVAGSVAFTLTVDGPAAAAPTSTATSAPTSAATAPTPTSAPAAEPTPPAVANTAGSSQDGGAPIWPWIAGAVVLVGGGVLLAMRLGR